MSDKLVLRVAFNEGASPLWLKEGNGEFEEYPLSDLEDDGLAKTARLLKTWNDDFLATLESNSMVRRSKEVSIYPYHEGGFEIARQLRREFGRDCFVEYQMSDGLCYPITDEYLLPRYVESFFDEVDEVLNISCGSLVYSKVLYGIDKSIQRYSFASLRPSLNLELLDDPKVSSYLIGDLELYIQLWASSWRLSLIRVLNGKECVDAAELQQFLGNGETLISKSVLSGLLNRFVAIGIIEKKETVYEVYETVTGDEKSQRRSHRVVKEPANYCLQEDAPIKPLNDLFDLTLEAINLFPYFRDLLVSLKKKDLSFVTPETVVLEEFLKVVARPRTASVLRLIQKHDGIRYRDLLSVSSKSSLSIILRELLKFNIVEKSTSEGGNAVTYILGEHGLLILDYYVSFESLNLPNPEQFKV